MRYRPRQLAYYRLLERRGECELLLDRPSLQKKLFQVGAGKRRCTVSVHHKHGGRGPYPLPAPCRGRYRAGLRVVGLAHYGPSGYAQGTGCKGGLTAPGRELLRVMEELNLTPISPTWRTRVFWKQSDNSVVRRWPATTIAARSLRGTAEFDDYRFGRSSSAMASSVRRSTRG